MKSILNYEKIKKNIIKFKEYANNNTTDLLSTILLICLFFTLPAVIICDLPITSETNNNLEPLVITEQDFNNSLIQLTNNTKLELVHTDDVKKEKIVNHTEYNEKNPVYLINVPFGQNIRFLKNRIKNDNIRIYYNNKNEEPEDNEVVRSGLRIVAKNGAIVTDTIIVVVFGDTDFNGRRTLYKTYSLKHMIKYSGNYKTYELLSGDINNDNKLDKADLVAFKNII